MDKTKPGVEDFRVQPANGVGVTSNTRGRVIVVYEETRPGRPDRVVCTSADPVVVKAVEAALGTLLARTSTPSKEDFRVQPANGVGVTSNTRRRVIVVYEQTRPGRPDRVICASADPVVVKAAEAALGTLLARTSTPSKIEREK